MATATKRAVKRKAAKGKETNSRAVKPVAFNSRGKAMRAAYQHAVAHDTSLIASSLVEQLQLIWAALNAGDADTTTAHARKYLNDVRDGIILRRKADVGRNFKEPAEVIGSRVSDALAQWKLHNFVCRKLLAERLATFAGLTTEALTKVARFMHSDWEPKNKSAPTHKALATVIKASKRRTRSGEATRVNGHGGDMPTGMPTKEIDRAFNHVIACLVAANKVHGKSLGTGERKIVDQTLAGLRGIMPAVRKIATANTKAANEAKAKKAADKAKKKKKS